MKLAGIAPRAAGVDFLSLRFFACLRFVVCMCVCFIVLCLFLLFFFSYFGDECVLVFGFAFFFF